MSRVLRLPRIDGDGGDDGDGDAQFVLIHVVSAGETSNLDLTLVGTEGEAPYVVSLKQSQISSLRSRQSVCTQEEWESILDSVLLERAAGVDDGVRNDLMLGVEAVASVDEGSFITITIQKRIENITQRLGTLQLKHNPEAEIQLYDWCGLAVQQSTTSAKQLDSLRMRLREAEQAVVKLRGQLEELTAMKQSHENELLGKFQLLLNEKKSKIRDQQRLLASASLDPEALAKIASPRRPSGHVAGSSRTSKRKAADSRHTDAESAGSDASDDGFERMGPATAQDADDSEQDVQTPGGSETADEEALPPPPRSKHSQGVRESGGGGGGGSKPVSREKRDASASNSGSSDRMSDVRDKTPPRRDLPFGKGKEAPMSRSTAAVDEDGTDSDDEL